MITKTSLLSARGFGLAMAALLAPLATDAQAQLVAGKTANHAANRSEPIPADQLGAVAGKQYQGDGVSVTATPDGARLRCVFQRLEAQVTPAGLWLTSMAEDARGERFRVVAVAVGRMARSGVSGPLTPALGGFERERVPEGQLRGALARTGKVAVGDQVARFIRRGLTEEYSVSVDGVRQDFVIAERPAGAGDLCVELALSGARAEAAGYGAKLRLESTGRELAYSRLRAVDASGKELVLYMEVLSAERLAVRVADAKATYPVRIDPTFSDANWVSLNPGLPGANSTVSAIAADASGNVYVGGSFTVIGTVAANYIAKWDGSTWSALGSGMNGTVYALAVSGTDLYAGGYFTTAGGVPATNIAKWDGSAWSALGAGMGTSDSSVDALAVSGTNLYAGGYFTNAGGVPANYIAKWDGSAWSALGSGMSDAVRALAVSGTDLYAGGWFTTAGGVANTKYVAKWNGSAWSALGSGMGGGYYYTNVSALAVSGPNLYAAGEFTTAGGVPANRIAKWNGSAWLALGSGIGQVSALAVSGTNLYAGGAFTTAGGLPANSIAKWDGSAWSALGSGMSDAVRALAVSGTDLYAGGYFTTAGGVPANYIAKWNGSAWLALGSGMNSEVDALAVSGPNLYAAGEFTTAGGVLANRIAKWDGSAWSALGSGIGGYDPHIYALAVSSTNVYAGGWFTNAGGVAANSIAKWDGSTWSALGAGIEGYVYALAVSGTNLYAGGEFTTADGLPANCIAKWDGSAWSALGLGMDRYPPPPRVNALVVGGTNLYAGGSFYTAGTVQADSIAKWDGSTWSALGSGINGYVYALAVSGTNLYAGGYFSMAGGVTADGIAKWDGSTWSALGSGIGGGADDVYALAVSGSNLYAGGSFTTAGGVPASGIGNWDGSAWSALGSGMSGTYPGVRPYVRALAADGAGHLFVGGSFYIAGTSVSPFIAQANIGVVPAGGRFYSPVYSPATGFRCTFSDATLGQPYRIQTSPSLAAGSWTDFTNFTYTGPVTITDPSAVAAPKKFYRAVTP